MPALLRLSPERIARETARAALALEDDRRWARRARVALVVASAWLALAYSLLALSFRSNDPDQGLMFFWAALAIGNFGPVMTGLRFWMQAET